MTVVNQLSEVDPFAITLCKQGANRQRIFLRKEHAPATGDRSELTFRPAVPLRKTADDWSAIYCIVAVPGAEEDPGMTGDADSVDVWASEDEIRKAAHRLLKNGGYVNAAHDEEAAEGAAIVESAVALVDMDLLDPAGDPVQIKKGSWYVAIEPNEALRKSIQDGTVESVSLEGTGIRTPVQKAKAPAASHRTCSKCGAHLAKDATKCPNCGTTWVAKSDEDDTHGMLRKLWQKVFPSDAVPAQLAKESVVPDFQTRIAIENMEEKSWAAFTTLRQVIYEAAAGDDRDNAGAIIRRSVDQFRDYLVGLMDGDTVALAKELGSLTIDQAPAAASQEDDVDETRVKQLIEEATQPIAKSVTDLVAALPQTIAKAVQDAAPTPPADEKPLTAADLKTAVESFADKMDGMDTALVTLAKSVDQLAEGESAQTDREPVRKTNGRSSLSLLD